MKFIANTSQLRKGLKAASGVIASVNTLPILDNFLFSIDNNRLTILASNIETTISVSLELSNSEGNGKIAVPAKVLSIISALPDVPVVFSVDESTLAIELKANEGVYKFSGFSAEEYPALFTTSLEGKNVINITSTHLQRAISKTLFATSNDDSRLIMTGIDCDVKDDHVSFISTDAHKLVRLMRTDMASENAANFVLPKRPLMNLRNILPSEEIEVQMEYNEKNVRFSFGDVVVVTKLIEGKYPNCDNVIPKENNNHVTIDRQLFLQSLQRVSIFANQATHQIRLKINEGNITITAEDTDLDNRGQENLACEYEGEPMEIGFNAKFLQEMLSNLETSNIRLELSRPDRPCLIRPVVDAENTAGEDLLMLLMPVVLN